MMHDFSYMWNRKEPNLQIQRTNRLVVAKGRKTRVGKGGRIERQVMTTSQNGAV